jgi:hypothetical protein
MPVESTEPASGNAASTATAAAPSGDARATEAPATDDAEAELAGKAAELRQLARDIGAYARALGHLALSEAALARINLVRLLLLALAVPAIVFGILLGVDALLAALALQVFHAWSIAVVCVLIVNVALLALTLVLLRRWWRSLSLPRSRAALARALEGLK